MTKAHSFSVFLLKEGFNATNALKEDNDLEADAAKHLPDGAVLYVRDSDPYPPWWKSYFAVQKDLFQTSKGALVFIPAAGRWFALSFGHVSHNLQDTSYEYDFGLRITLNCVDPEKLKSTDTLEPSGAKRQRTQIPIDGDLTYFDVDTDSTIFKSLTGKVKDEYKDIFKHATGAKNVRISSTASPAELVDLCSKLLTLYQDESYKTEFPGIQDISPVSDPAVIAALDAKLIAAIQAKEKNLSLSVPEIQNYHDGLWNIFRGSGSGKVYDDVTIDSYYEYLEEKSVDFNSIKTAVLKKHELVLTDEGGRDIRKSFPIYKCLLFDVVLEDKQTYHLCEGNWYQIARDYIAKLTADLDLLCKNSTLPEYNHKNEGAYNQEASKLSKSRICLDRENIAPPKQKQVEPCDIYEVVEQKAILHHIKISTDAPALSHLFNQGVNSINLLHSESEAMAKIKRLVSEKIDEEYKGDLISPLENKNIMVSFGIISRKDPINKSLNLPLFSRISLRRCMKELKRMGIEAEFSFIADLSPKNEGKKKEKAKRGK